MFVHPAKAVGYNEMQLGGDAVFILLSVRLWLGSDEKENSAGAGDHKSSDAGTRASDAKDYHRFDEQVNVCLDCCDPDMPTLPRKYIRYVKHVRYVKHIRYVIIRCK